MRFEACLFDLDGTLVDSLIDLTIAYNLALAQQGLPTHTSDDYRMFVGRGVITLVESILPSDARTPETIATTRRLSDEYYSEHYLDNTRPYEGVKELLSGLEDIPCAVVSNKPDEFTNKVVEGLFGNRFDVVLGQRDGTPRKPDPTGPLEACSLMAVDPGRCLFVGDSGLDMVTARAAGMFPVGALWGFRARQELVDDGARALLERPDDLLELLA